MVIFQFSKTNENSLSYLTVDKFLTYFRKDSSPDSDKILECSLVFGFRENSHNFSEFL